MRLKLAFTAAVLLATAFAKKGSGDAALFNEPSDDAAAGLAEAFSHMQTISDGLKAKHDELSRASDLVHAMHAANAVHHAIPQVIPLAKSTHAADESAGFDGISVSDLTKQHISGAHDAAKEAAAGTIQMGDRTHEFPMPWPVGSKGDSSAVLEALSAHRFAGDKQQHGAEHSAVADAADTTMDFTALMDASESAVASSASQGLENLAQQTAAVDAHHALAAQASHAAHESIVAASEHGGHVSDIDASMAAATAADEAGNLEAFLTQGLEHLRSAQKHEQQAGAAAMSAAGSAAAAAAAAAESGLQHAQHAAAAHQKEEEHGASTQVAGGASSSSGSSSGEGGASAQSMDDALVAALRETSHTPSQQQQHQPAAQAQHRDHQRQSSAAEGVAVQHKERRLNHEASSQHADSKHASNKQQQQQQQHHAAGSAPVVMGSSAGYHRGQQQLAPSVSHDEVHAASATAAGGALPRHNQKQQHQRRKGAFDAGRQQAEARFAQHLARADAAGKQGAGSEATDGASGAAQAEAAMSTTAQAAVKAEIHASVDAALPAWRRVMNRVFGALEHTSFMLHRDYMRDPCPEADKKHALTALLLAVLFPPASHFYYGYLWLGLAQLVLYLLVAVPLVFACGWCLRVRGSVPEASPETTAGAVVPNLQAMDAANGTTVGARDAPNYYAIANAKRNNGIGSMSVQRTPNAPYAKQADEVSKSSQQKRINILMILLAISCVLLLGLIAWQLAMVVRIATSDLQPANGCPASPL